MWSDAIGYSSAQCFDVGFGYGNGTVDAEHVQMTTCRIAVNMGDEMDIYQECAVAV